MFFFNLCGTINLELQNKRKGGSKMDHRAIIQRSLDYIEENLQVKITAAELAEAAGFSLFHIVYGHNEIQCIFTGYRYVL